MKVCDMKTGVANRRSGRWFFWGTTWGLDKLFARGMKKFSSKSFQFILSPILLPHLRFSSNRLFKFMLIILSKNNECTCGERFRSGSNGITTLFCVPLSRSLFLKTTFTTERRWRAEWSAWFPPGRKELCLMASLTGCMKVRQLRAPFTTS